MELSSFTGLCCVLRVNFAKSELIGLGIGVDGGLLAWLLGCKCGGQLYNYLGLPLGMQRIPYPYGTKLSGDFRGG